MSKKIYLNKSDSVASAIDKVLKATDEEVVLYIPRDAEVAGTKKDLELLMREVESAGKTIKVETVDDTILEKALAIGVEASNPFLGRGRATMTDIVVQGRSNRPTPKVGRDKKVPRKRGSKKTRSVVGASGEVEGELVEESQGSPRQVRGRMGKGKRLVVRLVVVVLIGALVTGAIVFLPRVTVSLTLDKMEYGFIGNLVVSSSIEQSSISDNTVRLRGVTFTSEKNLTGKYSANGTDSVGRKAKGIITIYNNFGVEPQPLVATTRFVTPDGKIYRLDSDITVPGATDDGSGGLTPSSIDAAVTADQPGEEYNIGPVSKFRIPGFQGSAKYDGFYGESEADMIGGTFGEVRVPTDGDIEKAKADASKRLEDALKAEFFLGLPENVKVLEGAYKFNTTREQINDVVDRDGMFNYTLYGEIKMIGFDEEELVDILRERFEEVEGVSLQIYEYTVEYAEVTLDLEAEELNSAINFNSNWIRPFDVETFREEITGMTETQLREEIFSTPGVRTGEVKMWPFWVNRVPENISRVSVDAQ